MSSTPRSWSMFAGPPTESGIRLHVDASEFTVRAYGDDPMTVTVIEDSQGIYLGWIDKGDDRPVMIQPHFLFSMQFPYGPQTEVERGKGEVVKLRVEADPVCERCGGRDVVGLWSSDGLPGHEILVCDSCWKELE